MKVNGIRCAPSKVEEGKREENKHNAHSSNSNEEKTDTANDQTLQMCTSPLTENIEIDTLNK